MQAVSCIGGTGFQPVRRNGKMPAPPFLVPKLPLGNPIAGQAPAWREKHLFIAAGGPSRSLGEIDVPKQELGNEGKGLY